MHVITQYNTIVLYGMISVAVDIHSWKSVDERLNYLVMS